MIPCTVCGSENLDGAIYCEDCGARLPVAAASSVEEAPPTAEVPAVPETPPVPPPSEPEAPPSAEQPPSAAGERTCPACGEANPLEAAFCDACGASLGEGAAPPPPIPPPEPTPAPPARPRLVLKDGSAEFPIDDKDEYHVGRRSPLDGIFPEVDLTEVDPESYVSRRHGRIVKRDGTFLYEDLGSSNGSFLNDVRLQKGVQTELKEGDRLRLGKTELIFYLH